MIGKYLHEPCNASMYEFAFYEVKVNIEKKEGRWNI
jgi:hypothetical protein